MPQHGLPSFRQVLTSIAQAWTERRDEVVTQGTKIAEHIARVGLLSASHEPLTDEITRTAFSRLHQAFDDERGGFGGAPKFPQPMTLEFVLRCAVRGWEPATKIVTTTLDRMAAGGIYDHLGGGFARYSTDASWHVPHFEKMLYDNAQLARLYTRAWQVTRDDRYRRVATETLEYLLREMQHAEGGFFSSQDADSEGVEGKFFVWSWDELEMLVGPAVAACLGATPEGNWEGTNVLWRPRAVADVAAEHGLSVDELTAEVEDARQMLFEVRERRVKPGTDDKVLTAWNALAIGAFAEAGRVFGEPSYVRAAARCAEFVLTHLRDERGRLLRSWRDGVAGRPGFADDYAVMASACLTLYETTFELRWFEEAVTLADELIRLFRDDERGGFFQTGSDAEELVLRPKELYDNATPSGNSVAADVLLRLATVHGRRGVRARRRLGAPPDPRRDGRSTDRVRPGALRARPVRRPVERGGDHRRPGVQGNARTRRGGDGFHLPPERGDGGRRSGRRARRAGDPAPPRPRREGRRAHRVRLRTVHVPTPGDGCRGTARSTQRVSAYPGPMLKRGDPAPAFSLLDQAGETVSLSDFAGRKLLVYFYPAADTPGCTTQSCAVRDAREDLSSLGVDVVGISPDVPEDQMKFDQKFGLGFPLLADTDHAIAEAYDVWGEKMNYGKTYMGIIRSSFLIDEDGRIEQAWYKVSPKDTVPNAQKALAGG